MQVIAPKETVVSQIPIGSVIIDSAGFEYLLTGRMAEEVGEYDKAVLHRFSGQGRHEWGHDLSKPVAPEEIEGALGTSFKVFTPDEYMLQLVKK
jgi:hypothetical protein